jgi:hypothetical protein
MMQDDVKAFLGALRPAVRGVVSALRDRVRRLVPEAEESVLWGGLSYHRPAVGGRVKGAVCQIGVKRDVVRLEFIHGVRMSDPGRRLNGDSLSKRFVPIRSALDAEHPDVAALIHEAASLDPTTWE